MDYINIKIRGKKLKYKIRKFILYILFINYKK